MNAKAATPGADASACAPRRAPRGPNGGTHSRWLVLSPALPFLLGPLVPKASGARPFVLLSFRPWVESAGKGDGFPLVRPSRRKDPRTKRQKVAPLFPKVRGAETVPARMRRAGPARRRREGGVGTRIRATLCDLRVQPHHTAP